MVFMGVGSDDDIKTGDAQVFDIQDQGVGALVGAGIDEHGLIAALQYFRVALSHVQIAHGEFVRDNSCSYRFREKRTTCKRDD